MIERFFEIFGTGHPIEISNERKFIGTFQINRVLGIFVFHMFEKIETKKDWDYGVHMSHCNQGEFEGSCKYGDHDNCPALKILK